MNTATDFFSVLQLLALAGDAQPPAAYRSAVEQMFNFYVYTSDQQGCLPRNGDSDVCGSGFSAAAAAYFNRSDWLYVHTAGANGSAPAQASPSNAFPGAGQVVFRSGFGSPSPLPCLACRLFIISTRHQLKAKIEIRNAK